MAYIVVYQREDGSSGLEECADLDLAVVTAERLRNVDSIERPRIMKTEELTYDFKPYYRVEVQAKDGSDAKLESPVPPPPAPAAEDTETHAEAMPKPDDADVETVTVENDAADEAAPEVSEEAEPAEEAAPSGDETVDAAMADPSVEHDTPTATGGLFGDRDAVAERLTEFPAVSKPDEDPAPSRRGLFGR